MDIKLLIVLHLLLFLALILKLLVGVLFVVPLW